MFVTTILLENIFQAIQLCVHLIMIWVSLEEILKSMTDFVVIPNIV
jgi:hypothetical protein